MDDCRQLLATAIDDYLLWMIDNDYSEHTVGYYGLALRHFQQFVASQTIAWDQVFTHERVSRFEKHNRLSYGTSGIRGLGRYLYQKGLIQTPIRIKPAPLPDIFEHYLCFCTKDRQLHNSYITVSRNILLSLNAYLTGRNIVPDKLRIEHIDDFLARYNRGYAPATCRHNRSYLRGFLRYLYTRQIVKTDLALLVVGPPNFAYTNPPKFLTHDQLKALFGMLAGAQAPKTLRSAAMVYLGYTLGLRPKEISLISLDDISFTRGLIRITNRKSTNPVKLPLPDAAIKAIAAYIVGARTNSACRRLFLTIHPPYRPVSAAVVSCEMAAILKKINPKASAYWLRHSYAQHLLESNASVFELKQMMGHDSAQSVRRYLHIHTKLMRKVLFDETL